MNETSVSTTLSKLIELSFFFFQAEDGIRDRTVTGVQTCALPISNNRSRTAGSGSGRITGSAGRTLGRSEERRVGKECRSWRAQQRQDKQAGRRLRRQSGRPYPRHVRVEHAWALHAAHAGVLILCG